MVDHAVHAAAHGTRAGAILSGDEADALEAGRKLFALPCRFVWAAQALDGLPGTTLPEIAFAGRSNVGKSSLLNALVGQKALARMSSRPGRTQQLNFFEVERRLMLVDMPGYGYAEAAKAVKQDWQEMMFAYLRGRPVLGRVMLLLDARVAVKPADAAAMELLDRAAVVYQLVLTKADAVSEAALAARRAEVVALARRRPAAHADVLVTSSESGAGIAALRAALAPFAAGAERGWRGT